MDHTQLFLAASLRFLGLVDNPTEDRPQHESPLDHDKLKWSRAEPIKCLELATLRGLVTGLTQAVPPDSIDKDFREKLLDGLRRTSKEVGILIVDKAIDVLDPTQLIAVGERLLEQIHDPGRKAENLVLADQVSFGIYTLATIRTTLTVYGADAPDTVQKFKNKLVRIMNWYEDRGSPITVFLTMEREDTLPPLDNLPAFLELMS